MGTDDIDEMGTEGGTTDHIHSMDSDPGGTTGMSGGGNGQCTDGGSLMAFHDHSVPSHDHNMVSDIHEPPYYTLAYIRYAGSEDEEETTGAAIGEDCLTDEDTPGVVTCPGFCSSMSWWIGDGYCDEMFQCPEFEWDWDDCDPLPLFDCTMTDGTDGVLDCTGECQADTSGDGVCDPEFDCADAHWDSSDCPSQNPGDICTYEHLPGEGMEPGIVNCKGDCAPSAYMGDGHCDTLFDCSALELDGGDCGSLAGTSCTDPGGSPGLYDCSDVCTTDTTTDGHCDAHFSCAETGWDGSDCESPEPSSACVLEDGTGSIVACDGSCLPYLEWWDDGWCDDTLDCWALALDGGDCMEYAGG
jgi:hypothetical protein